MFGLKGDPIADKKVKLDGTLICSILGSFLRADPESNAYIMPGFRVKQLVDRVGCCHGNDGMFSGPINPNVMEVTGCLFIICFHLASSPNLDGETVFLAARCAHMALGRVYKSCTRIRDRGLTSFIHTRFSIKTMLSVFERPLNPRCSLPKR